MARTTTKSVASGKKPATVKRAGRARPSVARPRQSSLEDAIVGLAASGKLAGAGRAAIRAQKEAGLPVTYQQGNEVIKEFPDGRREVLATLEPPTYRLPKGVARIRNGNGRRA